MGKGWHFIGFSFEEKIPLLEIMSLTWSYVLSQEMKTSRGFYSIIIDDRSLPKSNDIVWRSWHFLNERKINLLWKGIWIWNGKLMSHELMLVSSSFQNKFHNRCEIIYSLDWQNISLKSFPTKLFFISTPLNLYSLLFALYSLLFARHWRPLANHHEDEVFQWIIRYKWEELCKELPLFAK